ncbi:MAG: PIN domain-containing protein [Acidobacteria bacterium]|nr:MAG: PIN domain-containing protein [Acidobacteriota bacterium]
MRAVDTNLLVRLITRDDPRQADAAEAFVSKGAWVSHLVLADAVWVLDSVFRLKRQQIAVAVGMLIEHEHLTIQDADVVEAALSAFRGKPSLGFTDCLVLAIARKAGHVPLGTFDRRLSMLEGTELV